MVARVALVVCAFAASTCRVAELSDELRVSVSPRVLDDDGRRARVIVATNDAYGDPGSGTVHVSSSAGSLRDGLDLVLGPDGSVETQLTCEAKVDPDCHDAVTVTATWRTLTGATLQKRFALTLHTTDAFVSACAFANRRVLKLLAGAPPVVQLAVLDDGVESAPNPLGTAVWSPANRVGAVALNLPTRGESPSDEEALVRDAIGTAVNPVTQTFTTWDGYAAVRSTFDLDVTGDLKGRLDTLSAALGGPASLGLPATPSRPGPFKVELLVVRHDAQQSAVVVALTDVAAASEATLFDLEDVAGGSALAFATDRPVDHCEVFSSQQGKKVDFLWVVDDSCSMEASQTAVATVGSTAVARIQGAQLDFRGGGVSTGWYAPHYAGSYRPWTSSLSQMLDWFTPGGLWWGTSGNGDERGFDALLTLLDEKRPGTEFRSDSEVHIIFLSDTRDHSPVTADEMKRELDRRFPKQHVVVSGIVCPEGHGCGDDEEDAPGMGKYHQLIRATGGVLGSIEVFNPTPVSPKVKQQQVDTMNLIVGSVVNGAGYALQYRPITPSVRVAVSATVDLRCENRDVPRSRDDGWDLDPRTGRIAFNGRCLPQLGSTVVVSYQSWARYGTQVHQTTKPVFVVAVPPPDAGPGDAGVADAGLPDGG
ncbi:MAG: hypothetical protein IPJ65_02285 [Archangiaceae bacterium]|nr:hypothetical protein [Archangiaceae bacterium]